MPSKYIKTLLLGICLLLVMMLVSHKLTATVDMVVDRVAAQLTQLHGAPWTDQPKPRMVENWSDVVDYFRRQWENSSDITCTKLERAGNWKICQDDQFEIKLPCLVYSFGIHRDWSFDEHMGRKGCEVHAFDPSIHMEDHIHDPGNVSFHNLGIGPIDSDTFEPELDVYVRSKTIWKVRTVQSIMKMLGHEGRKLDVFKMDVETDEWETLINMIDTGLLPDIKQFLLEWHLFPKYPSKDRYIDFYHAYKDMRDAGFRSFFIKVRRMSLETIKMQADMNFVNTKYQK